MLKKLNSEYIRLEDSNIICSYVETCHSLYAHFLILYVCLMKSCMHFALDCDYANDLI